ncbi:MAG TPA: hypothetical protein DDW50_00110, partial [Firmicutes bacterium]|nr:hypothetical protein [Bacillota bacterium]
EAQFKVDELIYIPGIRDAVENGVTEIPAFIIHDQVKTEIKLKLNNLTPEDREIILAGCLINYYAKH